MSQELHYTSVARGLKPGSRGFGTVAATAHLPEALADRLEALSVYEAVYPPGDPSASLNPVAYLHVRLSIGGHVHEVLSRIGPAGLDYSGRPNKYAHHVILEPDERPDGGPAWLLSQPGFVRDAWDGDPRILAGGPPVPPGDRPPGVARSWQDLTGDAGWAGVLAESFLADPRRPVFLVFRPGMDLLPLFVEAVALLPVGRRWDVEFSTYLTTLPPGISCTWRGVLEGSPQAKSARRLPNALIVDLCRPLGRASGGGLVHLARTGERLLSVDANADATPRHASGHPPAVMAGPPPSPRAPGHAQPADAGRDWLPDLAARLAADESSLGGDRLRRRRSRPVGAAAVVTACLASMLAAAFFLWPGLRQRLGFEKAGMTRASGDRTLPIADRPDSTPRGEAAADKPRLAELPVPPPKPDGGPAPLVPPVAAKKAEAPAVASNRPASPASRPPAEPVMLAFSPPDVPRSTLGTPPRQEGTIPLPQETEDRVEILNGPEYRLSAVPAAPHVWEVSTRTGSGLGGGFALARLNHADAPTWRFEWTRNARAQSTPVEGLKDAILRFRGRDGRAVYVLLRGLEMRSDRPLEVWNNQKILFEKPDPRIRSVEWSGNPEVLEGTRWKPRIRRWRVALSRTDADAAEGDTPRRVIEPQPPADEKSSGADPPLERDLIPGEVRLKLAIDPTRPGTIDVRIEPDPEKIRTGRDERSARLEELRKATPRDKDGNDRDALEYRRARLGKLREGGARSADEIKTLETEIATLERINEVRATEDLLTRPARFELSVVIGLDVEGPGILDIVRIGAFAGDR
jgi:hypothetical protein